MTIALRGGAHLWAWRLLARDLAGKHGDHERHALSHRADRQHETSPGYSLHHRERSRRALQLLRDAGDPGRLHDEVPARRSRRAGGDDQAGSDEILPPVRFLGLLLFDLRIDRRRRLLREVPYDHLAVAGLLPGTSLAGAG